MTTNKIDQASRYRSTQVLLAVFSVIFFAIIAYGYFNLLARSGYFLATVGALIMATFAWYLARVIGTGPGGLRKHWVLFIPLLVVSAAGVYNSLMIYLEGNRILADTVVEAQGQFGRLELTARKGLAESGATARMNNVNSLSEGLFSEIRNPLNCGQGPEARRLIDALQRELPGFRPLSGGADCSRNEEVITDYKERIAALVARADWNNPMMSNVASRSAEAREALEEVRANVTTDYVPTMLRRTLSSLEAKDSLYRGLRHELSQQMDVRDVPPGLHLSEVQNLGNAFKLPALILERLDEPATYVYLLIALGFDLLMVHLFELVANNRLRQAPPTHSIRSAW